jgi:DNA-binding MarR family transcriptional regulator
MKKSTNSPIVPALERATHAVALWIERTFSDLRLTQAEAHVLGYLADHTPCSINDLHHSFGHKRSTLTSLLDRLESRGWICRMPHPTSRRLVQVELTDAGSPVAERVAAAVRSLEEHLLARVSQEDTTTFLRVIHRLEEEVQ